jgi:hypothetical protein
VKKVKRWNVDCFVFIQQSGGRSVGIVRSWTQATEFVLFVVKDMSRIFTKLCRKFGNHTGRVAVERYLLDSRIRETLQWQYWAECICSLVRQTQCNEKFALALTKSAENLDRIGRSQDHPTAYWLLTYSPVFRYINPNDSPRTHCCFIETCADFVLQRSASCLPFLDKWPNVSRDMYEERFHWPYTTDSFCSCSLPKHFLLIFICFQFMLNSS